MIVPHGYADQRLTRAALVLDEQRDACLVHPDRDLNQDSAAMRFNLCALLAAHHFDGIDDKQAAGLVKMGGLVVKRVRCVHGGFPFESLNAR
jgi:hypothetical protein